MMIVLASEGNRGIDILWTILAIIFTLGLIALLIFSILRERKRWQAQNEKDDDMSSEKIDKQIESGINAKQEFTLYCVEIIEYNEMMTSFGDIQFQSALGLFIKKIRRIFPNNIKISIDNDKLFILSPNKVNNADIEKNCNMIIYEAGVPIVIAGTLNIYFDIAIGAASFPFSGRNKQEMYDNVQVALLNSKRTGYNRFVIYDNQLGNRETQEYKNYLEIKEAIKANEFTLYYQPIVELDNKEVYAVESLLRWNHKTKGVLSPLVFLNILEQSGDINWVGLWSFEQLLKQKEQWKKSYPDSDFLITFNMSQKQIRSVDIVEELRRVVKRHHIAPNKIILEIIEPAALSSEEIVAENINKLHQLGFLIAIDNYGADFVSLHKLENLNVDMLKLEKKFFVSTMDEKGVNKGILDLLINFCDQKDISLIAMGIETDEEIAFAEQNNIKHAQGFYFSKPKNSKEIMQDIILTPWKN